MVAEVPFEAVAAHADVIAQALHHNYAVSSRGLVPKVDAKGFSMMCPIGLQPITTPVMLADGTVYEKESVVPWLKKNDRSPCTNLPLPHRRFVLLEPFQVVVSEFIRQLTPAMPPNLELAMRRVDPPVLAKPPPSFWEDRLKRLAELEASMEEMRRHVRAAEGRLRDAEQFLRWAQLFGHENIVKVQALVRGSMARRRALLGPPAIKIQKTFRGWQERQHVKRARVRLQALIQRRAAEYVEQLLLGFDGGLQRLAAMTVQCFLGDEVIVARVLLGKMVACPDELQLYEAAARLRDESPNFGKALVQATQELYSQEWRFALERGYARTGLLDVDGKTVCTVLGQLCARALLPVGALMPVMALLLGAEVPEAYHVECANAIVIVASAALRRASAACASAAAGQFVLSLAEQLGRLAALTVRGTPHYSEQLCNQLRYCRRLLLQTGDPGAAASAPPPRLGAGRPEPYRPPRLRCT